MVSNCDFAVFGAGSWGSALAFRLAANGNQVLLWGRDPVHVAAMQAAGENARYLPGIQFPVGLAVTADMAHAARSCKQWLISVPSHAFADNLQALAALARPASVVWATKGLEPASNRLLHEVVDETWPGLDAAVLSGPSFAKEVAMELPTAVTLATADLAVADRLSSGFRSARFRVYLSEDIVGVELGGAIKNVLAIASGISDGLGFGANTRAALITRGLAELVRLGRAMGAQEATLMGLSGLGDLVLTCTDDQSRNRRFGLALGGGASIEEAKAEVSQVVEGLQTVRQAYALASTHRVDMPIVEHMYRILVAGLTPLNAVESLLARQAGVESGVRSEK